MDSEDGRAWMVMQKRTNGALNFWNRTFDEYSQGFGDPSTDSWLGLKQIRQMIEVGYKFQLRMEIEGERCTLGQEDLYYVGTWDFSVSLLLFWGNFIDKIYFRLTPRKKTTDCMCRHSWAEISLIHCPLLLRETPMCLMQSVQIRRKNNLAVWSEFIWGKNFQGLNYSTN